MDDEHLPCADYDLAVVGTGLIECIVAGAAARVGKRVVHLDPNDFYGGDWASFALEGFIGYVRSTPERPRSPVGAGAAGYEGKAVVDPVVAAPAPRFTGVEEWRNPVPTLLGGRGTVAQIQHQLGLDGRLSAGDTLSQAAGVLGLGGAGVSMSDVCRALAIPTGEAAVDTAEKSAEPAESAVEDGGDAHSSQRHVWLPHHNVEWWATVQQAWQTGAAIASLNELEARLQTLAPGVDIGALRSMVTLYPGTEAPFLQSTLPHIIQRAMALPSLLEGAAPMPILQQGSSGVVELPRTVAASLLANMFLCNFPAVEDDQMPPRVTFSELFGGTQESGVAKLRMFVHYFERLCAEAARNALTDPTATAESTAHNTAALAELPRGVLSIRRNVVHAPPNWIQSPKPLRSVSVSTAVHDSAAEVSDSPADDTAAENAAEGGSQQLSQRPHGVEDAPAGCLQVDFANAYIGGGVLGRGCVQEEIRFAVCPESCVSMLICQRMTGELDSPSSTTDGAKGTSTVAAKGYSEALILTGMEQFSEYSGYGHGLRYSGDYVDTSTPRAEDGSLCISLIAIDALSKVGPPLVQLQDHYMQRELGKAFAGFSGPPVGDSSATSEAAVATGNWGCGVFGGFAPLKAVLQWMAASEFGRPMLYYPFDADFGPALQQLADVASAANKEEQQNCAGGSGQGFVTVGWMYRALIRFRAKLAARQAGKNEDKNGSASVDAQQLLTYLSEEIRGELAQRNQFEAQRRLSWEHLSSRQISRRYSLDIVPRLAFCRGPFVDLIVDSGLHRYAEFISIQGSYLFIEGGLHRVPCSKGEVFKDKFIAMKEKRVLMKFMQTVLSYEPAATGQSAVGVGTKSGALLTDESEVRRQHAAGVRGPEAAAASSRAAVDADAAELVGWLERPFLEFLKHKSLTGRLQAFILYALALLDGSDGLDGITTEQGLNALRRYMGCLGRFADTHTAFISTMYGAGEIPQAFCRCCAVYGGVYVLRRTMFRMLVGDGPLPPPEPEPEAAVDLAGTQPQTTVAQEPPQVSTAAVAASDVAAASDGAVGETAAAGQRNVFHGLICTAGQRLNARYLVAGTEHVSALVDSVGKDGASGIVVARAVCVATGASLVDGMGTILVVLPPQSLPKGQNPCCVRLQQMDKNAKLAPADQYVVHLTCSAPYGNSEEGEGEPPTSVQERLQGYLKEAVEMLFATAGCSEVVGATGDISTRQPRFSDAGCERAGPTLVWGVFFSRAIRTPSSQGGGDGESISPHNVFVAPDTWWGDIDFDAATKEAERIFKNIWPQASFLPALPDPDRQYQQEEEQLLLETEGTGDISATDFAPGRDVSVTFSDGMLGLQLEMDKQAGLIIVGGMADNGQAISSGRLSIGDILTTVAGQPVAAGISVEQVVKFLLQRPIYATKTRRLPCPKLRGLCHRRCSRSAAVRGP